MKLTPWFSGDQKPIRVGVYEVKYPFPFPVYSYWDGADWKTITISVKAAYKHKRFADKVQNLPWRGVMK